MQNPVTLYHYSVQILQKPVTNNDHYHPSISVTHFQGDRRQPGYGEQGQSFHQHHSDEEEEDEEGFARGRRRGPSVDEFLRGSELGRPVRTQEE